MSTPDPRRRGVRGQRLLVLVALFALALAVTITPTPGGDVARAAGSCGPGDAYRETLTLYGGAGTMHPCLSRVNLNLTITQSSSVDWNYYISKIRVVEGNTSLTFADGTTETNLVHITFESFRIDEKATMTVAPASGPSYRLTMKPDSGAVIGGDAVNTDLWVTRDSYVVLPVTLGFCGASTSVGTFAALDWLLNGSSWNGCSMSLDIRYLTVYKPVGTTTGSFPVRLPNTTITVS